MLIFIMVVMVVLAIIGTYGPMHDNFKEEQKKMDEEFEEIMRMADQNIKDLRDIGDDMIKLTKENIELHKFKNSIEESRENGVPEEEILKTKKDIDDYFLVKE